jgi:hypothetical protein
LANDSQTATKIASLIHDRIVGKRSANIRERMIKREIMRDNSGERAPLACWLRRRAATNFQQIAPLLHKYWQVADCSDKSFASLFPMKYLAGIEGHGEIEIGRRNRNELHRWIALSSTRWQSRRRRRSHSNIVFRRSRSTLCLPMKMGRLVI